MGPKQVFFCRKKTKICQCFANFGVAPMVDLVGNGCVKGWKYSCVACYCLVLPLGTQKISFPARTALRGDRVVVARGDEKAHVVLFRIPLENFLEGEYVHRLTIVRKVTWEDDQFYFFLCQLLQGR